MLGMRSWVANAASYFNSDSFSYITYLSEWKEYIELYHTRPSHNAVSHPLDSQIIPIQIYKFLPTRSDITINWKKQGTIVRIPTFLGKSEDGELRRKKQYLKCALSQLVIQTVSHWLRFSFQQFRHKNIK